MKMNCFIALISINLASATSISETFSIVAVDPVTGQVGCAAASCFPANIRFIADIYTGRGVIVTQASWNQINQSYARYLMQLGLSPSQIIDSLIAHDEFNAPNVRQYGIVDIINGGRSAAFTGDSIPTWRGHITGQTFSIQGNRLLGRQIIDSMKSRFINTPGQLAEKLMAALQGAKVIGADIDCLGQNKSSSAAFIVVARPFDPPPGNYFLDIAVSNTVIGRDPIDSLQTLFDLWLLTGLTKTSHEIPGKFTLYQNFPNPFNPVTKIRFDVAKKDHISLKIFDILGNEIVELVNAQFLSPGSYSVDFDASGISSGVYIYRLITETYTESKQMILLK